MKANYKKSGIQQVTANTSQQIRDEWAGKLNELCDCDIRFSNRAV